MPELVRFARTAGVWMLVVFHAALFVRRLTQPESLDATAALRWAGTFAVLAIGFALRAWASRLTQRQLLALALAVVALHAPMLQGPAEADRALAFWAAVPALLATVLALCGLAAARELALAAAPAASTVPRAYALSPARAPFSPRPPPIL